MACMDTPAMSPFSTWMSWLVSSVINIEIYRLGCAVHWFSCQTLQFSACWWMWMLCLQRRCRSSSRLSCRLYSRRVLFPISQWENGLLLCHAMCSLPYGNWCCWHCWYTKTKEDGFVTLVTRLWYDLEAWHHKHWLTKHRLSLGTTVAKRWRRNLVKGVLAWD